MNITEEQNLFNILNNITIFGRDVNMINKLIKLKYKSGESLLKSYETENIYQLIGIILIMGFDNAYNMYTRILSDDHVKNFTDFFYMIEIFRNAKENLKLQIENLENKIEVTDGAYVCSNCSSSKTISTVSQRRSLDEAGTLYIVCVVCHHSWKAEA